jgi:hypothetical protein
LDTAANSLVGSGNNGEVEEGLTTALDIQKPPVYDMHKQGAQMVLTLKITLVYYKSEHFIRFVSFLGLVFKFTAPLPPKTQV